MFRPFLSLLLSVLLVMQGFAWCSPAAAQEKTSHTLAVLDFIANGIPESEARMLSTTFRSQISREILSDGYIHRLDVHYTVVERSQMDKIFDEFKVQSTGCTDITCALEFGKILNVETIIIGEVGLVGETYILTVSLVDVETAKVQSVADARIAGPIDNLLNRVIPDVVSTLLYGKPKSRKKLYFIIGSLVVFSGYIAWRMANNDGGDTGSISYSIPVPPD